MNDWERGGLDDGWVCVETGCLQATCGSCSVSAFHRVLMGSLPLNVSKFLHRSPLFSWRDTPLLDEEVQRSGLKACSGDTVLLSFEKSGGHWSRAEVILVPGLVRRVTKQGRPEWQVRNRVIPQGYRVLDKLWRGRSIHLWQEVLAGKAAFMGEGGRSVWQCLELYLEKIGVTCHKM